MSDPIVFMGEEGFDLECENGVITVGGGLQNAVLFSILGGNETGKYWAGEIESTTLQLIRNSALTSAALLRLESAVQYDLAWMVRDKIASKITVKTAVRGTGRVDLTIEILSPTGDPDSYQFSVNWSNFP